MFAKIYWFVNDRGNFTILYNNMLALGLLRFDRIIVSNITFKNIKILKIWIIKYII